jgi:hypothetical protein
LRDGGLRGRGVGHREAAEVSRESGLVAGLRQGREGSVPRVDCAG